ncbi:glycosyltransferase [Neobacillus niacini]|uniref:glycosyltransferase n=1 Tax=Neobacillus niacini TaxID=86668 RepID=UPI002FFFAD8E
MKKNKYRKECHRKNQFIFAGRLDKTKGIDKLLKAWKLLSVNSEFTPILLVCGTGPEEEWCREFIIANSLEKSVKMLGFVENKSAILHIAESMALILPTQLYEGFPMTIVEAFGCGTPVLGSAIGNVESLVIEGVTGFTFDPYSSEEIADVVQIVMAMGIEKDDLFKSTYEYYKQHYTAQENYKDLTNIYEKVLAKPPAKKGDS